MSYLPRNYDGNESDHVQQHKPIEPNSKQRDLHDNVHNAQRANGECGTRLKWPELTLQQPSNPSTGYQWNATYDNSTLMLVNQTFVSGATNPSMVGAEAPSCSPSAELRWEPASSC